jgi:hypothetical protein
LIVISVNAQGNDSPPFEKRKLEIINDCKYDDLSRTMIKPDFHFHNSLQVCGQIKIYKIIIVFFMVIFVNKFPELWHYRVMLTAEPIGDKTTASGTSPKRIDLHAVTAFGLIAHDY